jgi:stearoyl-CoA desaturase (delta-9 desaturase)
MMMRRLGDVDWINTVTLVGTPVLAVLGCASYWRSAGIRWEDCVLFLGMYALIGLSITAGYHRLFSHKTYECHPVVEWLYLLFGAAGYQNSALEWSAQHRTHHREVDTDGDPYNAQRGFFWAHMGWIFFKNRPDPEFRTVPDLKKNPRVMFQHRHYLPLGLVVGIGLPTLVGAAYGSALGGFWVGGVLRLVVLHHTTFLINSAAHFFGTQPYNDGSSARDSPWLAVLTMGEGYHNFHHTFQGDYRNGVRWYQWDPSKWLIAGLKGAGLAWRLRRTSVLAITRARLRMARKATDKLLTEQPSGMGASLHSTREQLQGRIENAAFELTRVRERYTQWARESSRLCHRERRRLRNQWRARVAANQDQMRCAWRDYRQWVSSVEAAA